MTAPIQLISTDFDGTIFAEFESPPVAATFCLAVRDLPGARCEMGHQHWPHGLGRSRFTRTEACTRRVQRWCAAASRVAKKRSCSVRGSTLHGSCESRDGPCTSSQSRVATWAQSPFSVARGTFPLMSCLRATGAEALDKTFQPIGTVLFVTAVQCEKIFKMSLTVWPFLLQCAAGTK